MERKDALLKLRPVLNINENEGTTEQEKFQNKVLRPLLKFQHDLLCFTFLNAPEVIKFKFNEKHHDQQEKIIVDLLKTNQKLKSHIIHSISNLMTIEELVHFHSYKSDYKKRIIAMVSRRLVDSFAAK